MKQVLLFSGSKVSPYFTWLFRKKKHFSSDFWTRFFLSLNTNRKKGVSIAQESVFSYWRKNSKENLHFTFFGVDDPNVWRLPCSAHIKDNLNQVLPLSGSKMSLYFTCFRQNIGLLTHPITTFLTGLLPTHNWHFKNILRQLFLWVRETAVPLRKPQTLWQTVSY